MKTYYTDDSVLDAALNDTVNNVDFIVLCEDAPANFSEANTLKSSGGKRIARIAITSGNFTGPANGDVSGRKITFDQLTNQAMEEAGLGDHIALIDSGNSTLHHVHPEDEEHGGTAQAGAASAITLAAGASAADDEYNGMRIEIESGTGSGQNNIITDYNGTTKVATVQDAWSVQPSSDSVYTIFGKSFTSSDQVTFNAFDIEIQDAQAAA